MDSFAFLRGSAFALLAMAALIEAIVFFYPRPSISGVLLVTYAFFAYTMHRFFLFGEMLQFKPQKNAPKMKAGLFLTFSLVPVIVVLVIALYAFRGLPLGTAVVWSFGLSWLLASFFGTLLPWSVDRDRRYSLLNGIKTAPVTFIRFLMGPGLALIVVLVSAIAIERVLPELPEMVELGLMTFYRFLGFIPMALTAAVLCKSYREALARVPEDA